MIYYKKVETRLNHDRARQKHIKELQCLRNDWNKNKDFSVLAKLVLYENQLVIYDRIMGYDKIDFNNR